MTTPAFIELTDLAQTTLDLKSSSPGHMNGHTGSPGYDCSRVSPSSSPQTPMNTSFDSGFHQTPSATSSGQTLSPSCQQYGDGNKQSMRQCMRSAYGELYADQDNFSTPVGEGVQQIPTSPECGYRGGEMPSSPSSQSDISSCISTGETWVGTATTTAGNQHQYHLRGCSGSPYPSPTHPSPNLNLPAVFHNHSMAYPPPAQSSDLQHHVYTTEQQVPPYHTMLPDVVSPGQLLTVSAHDTCQVNPFDVAAFPGFVMGHNINHSNNANCKPKRKRIINKIQRKAANIRERKRMFNLNEAFDDLRSKIPKFSYEKKMSRIETLRLAITYISFMTDVLQGIEPSNVKLPKVGKFELRNFENMNLPI